MADIDVFDIGDVVRMSIAVTEDGQARDPVEVTFKVLAPDGTVTTSTATRVDTGSYRGEFTATMPGVHWVRMSGSADRSFGVEDFFVVRKSKF